MLKSILATDTFKQSQVTIVGTIINGVLGALFYIVLARFLGPSDFGLLTVSIAALTLIADLSDLGTNTGLVKFVSSNLSRNREKSLRFLKLSLEIKILVWLVILSLGIYFSPVIAGTIFNKADLVQPLRLVMVGVGGALLFSFATSSLQAFQKYFTWNLINISTNLFRLLFISLLLFYGQLNLMSGLIAYLLLPFFGFSLALLFIPTIKIITAQNEFGLAKQFLSYNVWIALFTLVAAVSSRLDTFISARLLSPHQIGIYGVANQLSQIVPQIVGALGVVAAPKFASFVNTKQMVEYLKKFQLLVIGLSVLGLFAIPISYFAIPFLYGQSYIEAVVPFITLFLAMLVFLISVPIHSSIIYYFGKPQVFVLVSIVHLLIVAFLGYALISSYGATGAAMTVLAGTLFNFLAPLIWLVIKLRQ